MLVREWMTPNPTCIQENETIPIALERLREHRFRRLPVMRGERLVGIVSSSDLHELFINVPVLRDELEDLRARIAETRVASVMSKNVITVPPDATLEEAALLMRQMRIGGIPVLDAGKLVGIITESNIFDAFVELLGARTPGARVEIDLGERPEAVHDVLDALKDFAPLLYCSLAYSKATQPQKHSLLLKTKSDVPEFDRMVERIRGLHLHVTDARYTEPLGGIRAPAESRVKR